MKRALDALPVALPVRPKTSDTSSQCGFNINIKRLRRDGSRAKHLRRGPSSASSAQEYMKSEWTCDELDLNKQISSLSDLAHNKFKLVEELFSIFSILEVKEFTPDILKEYSVNQLKELCLEELNSLSTSKITFMTEGNDPSDYVEPDVDTDTQVIGGTNEGIQLSVDDNEYSDFLGAENLEQKKPKKCMKDAEVQANFSSLESSSDDESGSDDKEGEGWMNLWKLEQMEILELEMRARAIRMLLKQEEEESVPDTKSANFSDHTKDETDQKLSLEDQKSNLVTTDTSVTEKSITPEEGETCFDNEADVQVCGEDKESMGLNVIEQENNPNEDDNIDGTKLKDVVEPKDNYSDNELVLREDQDSLDQELNRSENEDTNCAETETNNEPNRVEDEDCKTNDVKDEDRTHDEKEESDDLTSEEVVENESLNDNLIASDQTRPEEGDPPTDVKHRN